MAFTKAGGSLMKMSFLLTCLLLPAALMVNACSNLGEFNRGRYSLWRQAMDVTGLSSEFAEFSGTVFAFTDNGFRQLLRKVGLTFEQAVSDPIRVAFLRDVMLYHMYPPTPRAVRDFPDNEAIWLDSMLASVSPPQFLCKGQISPVEIERRDLRLRMFDVNGNRVRVVEVDAGKCGSTVIHGITTVLPPCGADLPEFVPVTGPNGEECLCPKTRLDCCENPPQP